MRKGCILLGIVVGLCQGVLSAGAATDEALARMDGDLVGRFHFAGTTRLLSGPAASKLNELAALPETTTLQETFLERLSTTPYRLFQHKIANGNTNDYSALFRPLLEDLLHEESYAEMRGPNDAVPELMLAVHLNSNRAKVWRDNLSKVLSTWTGIPVTQIKGDGFTGWELKKHHDPNVIRFMRAGDWVLFGWGENDLRLQPAFLQRIKKEKRPVDAFRDDWLDVAIDWPTLMRHHPFNPPAPLPTPLPKMHLTVSNAKGKQEDHVRPKLVVQFPETLQLKLDPWKIPTDMVRNPLVSFTAVRGVAPWLSQIDVIKKAQPPFVPNQLVFWSMAKRAFESGVAMPVPNASNYLAQVGPRLVPELINYFTARTMPNRLAFTNGQIFFHGMPFIIPNLSAVHEADGDFLRGQLMPIVHRTNAPPFPRELMKEILSKPDMVCYSWEINQERIIQWNAIHEIYLMDTRQTHAPGTAPASAWLRAAGPKLGNCATEVTLTGPNELTVLRNGPVGLTGLEMTLGEYWLDAPNFPLGLGYPPVKTIHSSRKPK